MSSLPNILPKDFPAEVLAEVLQQAPAFSTDTSAASVANALRIGLGRVEFQAQHRFRIMNFTGVGDDVVILYAVENHDYQQLKLSRQQLLVAAEDIKADSGD